VKAEASMCVFLKGARSGVDLSASAFQPLFFYFLRARGNTCPLVFFRRGLPSAEVSYQQSVEVGEWGLIDNLGPAGDCPFRSKEQIEEMDDECGSPQHAGAPGTIGQESGFSFRAISCFP